MTLTNFKTIQDYQVIGYLDSIDDIRFTSDVGNAYFLVKVISDWPISISEDDLPKYDKIQVYLSNIEDVAIEDNDYLSDEQRQNSLFEILNKYLFVIQPKVVDDGYTFGQKNYKAAKVFTRTKLPNFDKQLLMPVPVFSNIQSNVIKTVNEFEKRLIDGKVVGEISNPWSRDEEDQPNAVVWEENGDSILYRGIKKQHIDGKKFSFEVDKENLVKINLASVAWSNNIYDVGDILFIPAENVFDNSEPFVNVTENQITEKTTGTSTIKTTPITVTEEKTQDKVIEAKKPTEELKATVSINSEGHPNSDVINNDASFIDTLIKLAKQHNLYYQNEDLVNFHTAMKSDGMVILSGLSGTGKSQLVEIYAEALGLQISADSKKNNQLQFIPVRPFWNDDADLVGYADLVNSVYHPGESGLIDTLIAAQNNPDKVYIVVFDEMNLARVEHYFSQFLSVLERKVTERCIKLYSEELEGRLYNSSSYPAKLLLGDNIFFVGTINTDESTYQFSDKVLDRLNVISLEMVPFETMRQANNEVQVDVSQYKEVTMDEYRGMQKISLANELTKEELEMLWQLHLELNKADKNLGIGWRIITQINDYLVNLSTTEEYLSRSNAIDLQIKQRIMSKMKGSDEQLNTLVGSEEEVGEIQEILDKYANISEFTKTREVIKRKAKELSLYGFTI